MIEISKEEIEEMKEDLPELFDDDTLERLNKNKMKIGRDSVILADLFLTAYDTFSNNLSVISSEHSNKIKELLEVKFPVENIRVLLEEYSDGHQYYSYYAEEKIKKIINENREEITKFVNLFCDCFLGDL